jgi:signal transduction histidine kinase
MLRLGDATDAVRASREAAVVLAAIGVLTAVSLVLTDADPVWGTLLAVMALASALAGWLMPWALWGLRATAVLALLAFALLTLFTWVFDGYASAAGPLFVLVFAWLGLHFPLRAIGAAAPVAAMGYAVALIAADAPARRVASTVVLIPIAVVVGVLIARTVAALRETQRSLEVKERWRAALMATLAHDVRSPLTSISGLLEVLEDDPDLNPKYDGLVHSATRQADRILRLATGLLEVERVEQGHLRLDRHQVDLRDLAQEVRGLTDPQRVQVDVAANLTTLVDRQQLEQIVYNLVNNALRHGEPPVVIGGQTSGADVVVTVRDHGVGVPAADQGRLFERFTSADRSPRSVGLGLWIVELLTTAHGGTVRYEPADPGARFIVTLPAAVNA